VTCNRSEVFCGYSCFLHLIKLTTHSTSASRGVSILLNKSLNFAILDKWEDTDGRLLLLNIQIDDTILTLVCMYAPNCKTARNAFFKKVSSIWKEYRTGIILS
jgi:exonuclease III